MSPAVHDTRISMLWILGNVHELRMLSIRIIGSLLLSLRHGTGDVGFQHGMHAHGSVFRFFMCFERLNASPCV